MRWQTKEKINAEYAGTNLSAEEYWPSKPISNSLTEIQVIALKEEVRNEAAKACMKSLENSEKADSIKFVFSCECRDYENGQIDHKEILKRFSKAITQLNELRYEEPIN